MANGDLYEKKITHNGHIFTAVFSGGEGIRIGYEDELKTALVVPATNQSEGDENRIFGYVINKTAPHWPENEVDKAGLSLEEAIQACCEAILKDKEARSTNKTLELKARQDIRHWFEKDGIQL